jgi:hypothetical protein
MFEKVKIGILLSYEKLEENSIAAIDESTRHDASATYL